MAPNRGKMARGGRQSQGQRSEQKSLKRKRDLEDIDQLVQRVADLNSKPEVLPKAFSELPLSHATQSGLEASHFNTMTVIQAHAIAASLKGSDILGAAKTGSGKTLAFLVPVLENLYRKRWTEYDGVGALILSPTRELAIQIFEVLRKAGRNHTFSAGLVIGGKSLQEERERLSRMNILVATPGRMLQHMDQTADLDIGNLQMLVLDEADRIMDMGFKDTVDAIVEHLPKQRQTLMFSATQTKKVSDLARLSMHEPEFVSVHEAAESATPATLQQNYVITPLPEKLDTLWSFLRANVKKKILVFLSSGKQVRFVYEAFRHLQPGLPLLHLHGRQKQTARLDITTKFSNSKYACLFSTDVAARGLDFPAVDWVVQVDCPEDADTYIHRVGRTARYEHEGRAVLLVDPSEEEGMMKALEQRRVVGIEAIRVRENKMQNSIKSQLQNMCFRNPELKYLGQKAFVSYVRSVHVQKDKNIFNVKNLDLEGFASSMGLPGAPRVKFIKGEDAKSRKNMPRALAALDALSDSGEDGLPAADKKEKVVRTKYDRMFERRNQDVLADHYSKLIDDSEVGGANGINADTADADEDDDFMAVKRRFRAGDEALGGSSMALASLESDSDAEDDDDRHNSKVEFGSNRKIANKSGILDPTADAMKAKKAIVLSSNPDATPLIVDSNRRSKLLKSMKALLKYKGHGSHLVFSDDDEGQGKEKVYYQKEEEFERQGAPEDQRQKFLDSEKYRVQAADTVDRAVAREKRREKKIRRKERERGIDLDSDDGDFAADAGAGVQLGGNEVHIPVDLGPYSESESDTGAQETQRNGKRKWFEESESAGEGVGRKKGRGRQQTGYDDVQEPQTLEDLEAMVSGLIASHR